MTEPVSSDEVGQVIKLPNGNELTIHRDGSVSILFHNGISVSTDNHGSVDVQFENQRYSHIHPNGTTMVIWAGERKTATIYADGSFTMEMPDYSD